MEQNIFEILDKFRNSRRTTDSYRIFRAVKMRLEDMAMTISKNPNEVDNIIEDFENIAYKRVMEEYNWMKDEYIWTRPHKSRKTKIRYDLKEGLDKVVREDEFLKNFLINVELMMLIKEFNGDSEKFWKSFGGEIDECGKKIHN